MLLSAARLVALRPGVIRSDEGATVSPAGGGRTTRGLPRDAGGADTGAAPPVQGPNMPPDDIARLHRQLRCARRNLEADMPYSPAWAATREWVDELEREFRDHGIDPDDVSVDRRHVA
jgi:hypothetical protein